MKVYGAERHDTIACRWGCCGNPLSWGMRKTGTGRAHRKIARKRARRKARIEIRRTEVDTGAPSA